LSDLLEILRNAGIAFRCVRFSSFVSMLLSYRRRLLLLAAIKVKGL
jgi:hypothetical protein